MYLIKMRSNPQTHLCGVCVECVRNVCVECVSGVRVCVECVSGVCVCAWVCVCVEPYKH